MTMSFPANPVIYVHLISGDVERVSPANNVRVTRETVEVRNDDEQVSRFTARDVLFCSHEDVAPFPLS